MAACGESSYAVRRENATDIVAENFRLSFGSDYQSLGGSVARSGGIHEYPVTGIPEIARAEWRSQGAQHCKEIHVAESVPPGFPAMEGSSTMIFRIIGPDEITVLFEVPEVLLGGAPHPHTKLLLPPRTAIRATDCADAPAASPS